MKLPCALTFSGLVLAAQAYMYSAHRPNPDYPGTRDITTWPDSYGDIVQSLFERVPNDITGGQIQCLEAIGEGRAFADGEVWVTIGGRRVMVLSVDEELAAMLKEMGEEERLQVFGQEDYALETDYPLVTSWEQLNALMEQARPEADVRAEVAQTKSRKRTG